MLPAMALLIYFIILKLLPLILLAFFFSNFSEKVRIITREFYHLLPSSALWKTLLSGQLPISAQDSVPALLYDSSSVVAPVAVLFNLFLARFYVINHLDFNEALESRVGEHCFQFVGRMTL